jgi:hypothetical protein
MDLNLLRDTDQLDDPAVNRGMIDEQAALLHDLFEIAQTQRVGDVPPDAQQHDVQWKSQPLDHASRIVHKQRQVRHQSPDRCLLVSQTNKASPTFTRGAP